MSNLAPPPEEVPPDGWLPPILDAVDLVKEAETMVSVFVAERYVRVEAMRRDALAEAARYGSQLAEMVERSVRLELAAALGVTEAAAGVLLAEADALVNRYPTVLESLAGARIAGRHATLLVAEMDAVEPEFHEKLLGPALELAESLPMGTFRRKLRALIDTVRATTLTERHEKALDRRRVVVEMAGDGMGWLHWYGPAVQIHAAHGRITAQAKALAGRQEEARSLDQRRADITGDLFIDGDTIRLPEGARGIRATVMVTVPVLALLHPDTSEHGIAAVEGVGPIPVSTARELCGGAEGWMRVLTHPETGIVLSVGRRKYRPPADLRKLARWRAETCRGPGCTVPASRCEIDHTVAWEHGGPTDLSNLTPLCKGHHTLKHHGAWHLEQVPDGGGAVRWTSPTGRHYLVEPERRTPAFTSAPDAPPF